MKDRFTVDKLQVLVLQDKNALGEQAAADASQTIREFFSKQDYLNIIFAAAPSQSSFLEAIKNDNTIQWNRINAFHMDEYLDLDPNAPQRFGNFLKRSLFNEVPFRSINYIDGNASNREKEIARYGSLLKSHPPDIIFMGIGENTHLAFNEPFQARFTDTEMLKVVMLDPVCRQQQVNDGCFASLHAVPLQALTITIPVLMSARYIFCMVPGSNKANAVAATLQQPVSEEYPSTILRTHTNAVLYLDEQSASLLPKMQAK